MKVYSYSYWLTIHCATYSSPVMLAKERSKNIENSRKKTQYLINTLYLLFLFMFPLYIHTDIISSFHI